NPILWAGAGIHYAEAGERMAALAELIPAPIVTTNPGKSAIPDSHPLSLGASTRSRSRMFTDYMAKADLVLAVGSSLTRTPFGPAVPPGKTIIHSTNEASDINKEYRVDLGLIGDAGLVLDALIEEVGRQKGAARGGNALTSLKEEIAAAKKAWLAEGAKLAAPDKLCINVMGDAAIGMTGMDIETAARNRIAILTIVFNNGVMGAEREELKLSDKKYGAMTVGGNYSKVAEGLNVAATR